MANICCPSGYYYNGLGCCPIGNVCNLNQSLQVATIPCGCCPVGTTYINPTGQFSDPRLGTGTISNPDIATYADTCVQLVNVGGGKGWAISTGDVVGMCPCCLPGYNYSSVTGLCVNSLDITDSIATIPCITCNCVDPIVPTCPTCGTSGVGINYQFDFFSKQCIDCIPDALAPIRGNLGCFLPLTYPDTNIQGFKLKQ